MFRAFPCVIWFFDSPPSWSVVPRYLEFVLLLKSWWTQEVQSQNKILTMPILPSTSFPTNVYYVLHIFFYKYLFHTFTERCYVLGLFLVFGNTTGSNTPVFAFREHGCREWCRLLGVWGWITARPLPIELSFSASCLWSFMAVACLLGISLLNCELFLPFNLSAHLGKVETSTSREAVYVWSFKKC